MSRSILDISAWAASTSYLKYDIAQVNNLFYYASFGHVSSSNFNTDLAAGNFFGYINDNSESKPYFNFIPSYKPTIENTPKIKKIQFGDSFVQRLPDGISNILPLVNISFDEIETNEMTAILHFLQTRNGTESFLWTPPAPIAKLTRWICEKWSYTLNFYDNYSIQATFERSVV